MCYCKKDVTPVCQQWSYVFIALTHQKIDWAFLPIHCILGKQQCIVGLCNQKECPQKCYLGCEMRLWNILTNTHDRGGTPRAHLAELQGAYPSRVMATTPCLHSHQVAHRSSSPHWAPLCYTAHYHCGRQLRNHSIAYQGLSVTGLPKVAIKHHLNEHVLPPPNSRFMTHCKEGLDNAPCYIPSCTLFLLAKNFDSPECMTAISALHEWWKYPSLGLNHAPNIKSIVKPETAVSLLLEILQSLNKQFNVYLMVSLLHQQWR